jgi:hypothetical protein
VLLSGSQKNDVFTTIVQAGLSPGDFDLRSSEEKDTILIYRESRSYFLLGDTQGRLSERHRQRRAPAEAVRNVLMMLLKSVAHLFGHPLAGLSAG